MPVTCCVCKGTRKIPFVRSLREMQNVWSREGCFCDTCKAVRQTEVTIWVPLDSRESYADGHERRRCRRRRPLVQTRREVGANTEVVDEE